MKIDGGDEPRLYSIRAGLYADMLRLSRRCEILGSLATWTGSESRRLIRMQGISSAACRFSKIPDALSLGNGA